MSVLSGPLSDAKEILLRTSSSWANQVRILQLRFEGLKATIGPRADQRIHAGNSGDQHHIGKAGNPGELFPGIHGGDLWGRFRWGDGGR